MPARRPRPPRPDRAAARSCTGASSRCRGRDPDALRRSPRACCSTTSPPTCTRATRPNAERRAAALSLDRDLLRELLGQEELRDLIDPDALEQVEADLQFRSEHRRATGARHAARRAARARRPDRRRGRATGCSTGSTPSAMLDELVARAARDRDPPRRRGALDRRRRRRALPRRARGRPARRAAGGVPRGRRRRRSSRIVRRYAATHGPFTTAEIRARYGVDLRAALGAAGARRRARARRAAARAASEREWCHPEVLRRLRRASLAVLRKEIEPAEQRALARFLPGWQGVDRHPASGRRRSTGCARCSCRCRGWRCPPRCGSATCCRAASGAYSPAWMDELCAAGELVWIGAGALGRNSGRVALYFREDLPLLGAAAAASGGERRPRRDAHAAVRDRLERGACFFTDLLADVEVSPEELQEALWDLVWAGEVTNDAFAPLRAPRLTLARAQREQLRAAPVPGRAASPRRRRGGAAAPGPGPLVADRAAVARLRSIRWRAGARSPSCCSSATGSSPARRCSPRASPGGFSRDLLRADPARDARRRPARLLRRGPRRGAVRAARARSSGCARSGDARRGAARAGGGRSGAALRRGAAVAGARRRRRRRAGRRGRRAPTSCSPAASRCCTSSAAGGRSRRSSPRDDERLEPALAALVAAGPAWPDQAARAREGRRRVGARARRSGPRSSTHGFQEGPRRLTLGPEAASSRLGATAAL